MCVRDIDVRYSTYAYHRLYSSKYLRPGRVPNTNLKYSLEKRAIVQRSKGRSFSSGSSLGGHATCIIHHDAPAAQRIEMYLQLLSCNINRNGRCGEM